MTVTVVPAYEALDRAHVTEDEPAVIDVVFERDGERIAVDDGVSILFENDRHDDAFRVELEETDGAYSTIQALPEPEFWDARVTASIEGDEVSERVELYAIPADHDHGDHDHDHVGVADGPLAPWLRLGAVGIGLVGTVAIALETIRFERLQRRE